MRSFQSRSATVNLLEIIRQTTELQRRRRRETGSKFGGKSANDQISKSIIHPRSFCALSQTDLVRHLFFSSALWAVVPSHGVSWLVQQFLLSSSLYHHVEPPTHRATTLACRRGSSTLQKAQTSKCSRVCGISGNVDFRKACAGSCDRQLAALIAWMDGQHSTLGCCLSTKMVLLQG